MFAIGGLIPLVILAGIVYLIVRAVQGRERREASPESTGRAVRRLFHYALLFASLLIAAFGIIGLFAAILESDETIAGDASDLAVPLALTIVGVPLFAGLALWSRRCLVADPDEQRSIAWVLYLSGSLLVSLVGSIIMLSEALSWAFGSETTGGASSLAAACVWLAIWAAHWWVGARYEPLDELRTQRLAGSAIALWVGAGFLIATASAALSWVYDELFRTTIGSTIGDDLRNMAPPAVIGAVAWWWYWLHHAVRDRRTGLWNGYTLLVGVLPGLMVMLVGAAIGLFTTLDWAFGSPDEGAADQFAVMPVALSLMVVGAGVLFYHRGLAWRRHTEARAEIDRVYDYVVTAVGLVATGIALVTLIVAGIQAIAPAPVAEGGDSDIQPLLLAITLFVIGGPLWWYFWSRVQRYAVADPVEARSPSRRLYLFLSFGVGGVAAVISLIVALATVLRDLLDGVPAERHVHGWQ
ncbi:MAG: hypothetical protein EHM57_03270 [Actinobacteria bacterium]|nr:MAG: hypothetical protein EHM57_03270 [Actinomycetota bacterium]